LIDVACVEGRPQRLLGDLDGSAERKELLQVDCTHVVRVESAEELSHLPLAPLARLLRLRLRLIDRRSQRRHLRAHGRALARVLELDELCKAAHLAEALRSLPLELAMQREHLGLPPVGQPLQRAHHSLRFHHALPCAFQRRTLPRLLRLVGQLRLLSLLLLRQAWCACGGDEPRRRGG
jgi:hypothetical protein